MRGPRRRKAGEAAKCLLGALIAGILRACATESQPGWAAVLVDTQARARARAISCVQPASGPTPQRARQALQGAGARVYDYGPVSDLLRPQPHMLDPTASCCPSPLARATAARPPPPPPPRRRGAAPTAQVLQSRAQQFNVVQDMEGLTAGGNASLWVPHSSTRPRPPAPLRERRVRLLGAQRLSGGAAPRRAAPGL